MSKLFIKPEKSKKKDKTWGVGNYLLKRGIPQEQCEGLIGEYLLDKNVDIDDACFAIQRDFGAFVRFINDKFPR